MKDFKSSFSVAFLFLFLAHSVCAQVVLSGKFKDKAGHPIEYLEVTVLYGDSVSGGTLTDL